MKYKILFLYFFAIACILAMPHESFAEVFAVDINKNMKPVKNIKKLCIIDYKNGFQKMATYVDFDPMPGKDIDHYVWILPIPGDFLNVQIGSAEALRCNRNYPWMLCKKKITLETFLDFSNEMGMAGYNVYKKHHPNYCAFEILGHYDKLSYSSNTDDPQITEAHGSDGNFIHAPDIGSLCAYLEKNGEKVPNNLKLKLGEYIAQKNSFIFWRTKDIKRHRYPDKQNDIINQFILASCDDD